MPGQERLDEGGALRFAVGSAAYAAEYDLNGNMTSRVVAGQAQVLEWDAENRLVGITQGASVSAFVYDADGNRVKATVDGVTTVYIGGYYEETAGTARTYYYHAGQRVAMREAGVTTWLLGDHLRSTTVAYRETSGETTSQHYYAWGTIRPGPENELPTDYTYTGQRLDERSGLLYYVARWYDPQAGRFLSPDSIVPEPGNPQSLNRFAYAGNNPLRYSDPSGHMCDPGGAWGGPYYPEWDIQFQDDWAADHGGVYLSDEQVAVMNEAWSKVAAFSDQVGKPQNADAGYDRLGSVLSREARQLPPGGYEVGIALGGSPIALAWGYLASDRTAGPDGMVWAYSGYVPAGASAWTLGNTVIFTPAARGNPETENHEYVHVLHYRGFGEAGVSYGDVYLDFKERFGVGRDNPLETSAYEVQDIYRVNKRWLPDLWDLARYRRR